tara:strand:- start:62 stop:442 length:381 start_codon:yes stop_codon:yes gene_type:complete
MNQLKNIENNDAVENNSKKKTDKTILRNWCELHILDHHKFVLLDSLNHCYYLYEKKYIEFKPHHFNGSEFFNANKFINNNNSDIIFNNELFKIILLEENLKLKKRDIINKNIKKSLKKRKVIYIEF